MPQLARGAGTAGSVLGSIRFGLGGIAAPFVGIAGSLSILPLGLVTAISVVLAAAACLLFIGRHQPGPEAAAQSNEHVSV